MKEKREEAGLCSRRENPDRVGRPFGGRDRGRISNAVGAPKPAADKAPPLPWKWVKLDPLEAGRRAYLSYLKNKG